MAGIDKKGRSENSNPQRPEQNLLHKTVVMPLSISENVVTSLHQEAWTAPQGCCSNRQQNVHRENQ